MNQATVIFVRGTAVSFGKNILTQVPGKKKSVLGVNKITSLIDKTSLEGKTLKRAAPAVVCLPSP